MFFQVGILFVLTWEAQGASALCDLPSENPGTLYCQTRTPIVSTSHTHHRLQEPGGIQEEPAAEVGRLCSWSPVALRSRPRGDHPTSLRYSVPRQELRTLQPTSVDSPHEGEQAVQKQFIWFSLGHLPFRKVFSEILVVSVSLLTGTGDTLRKVFMKQVFMMVWTRLQNRTRNGEAVQVQPRQAPNPRVCIVTVFPEVPVTVGRFFSKSE